MEADMFNSLCGKLNIFKNWEKVGVGFLAKKCSILSYAAFVVAKLKNGDKMKSQQKKVTPYRAMQLL